MELGYSALTRRDRLERIATAERDRRAGRIDMAVAALGEPTEWPARAVLALARLPEDEGVATRRVLESGLDAWADELGLERLSVEQTIAVGDDLSFDALDVPTLGDIQDELDRPIEACELDEAFAHAETQVEEMHDVNEVAERVLLDEPLGLAEIAEEGLEEIVGEPVEHGEALSTPVFFEPSGPPASDAPILPATSHSSGTVFEAGAAEVLPADLVLSEQEQAERPDIDAAIAPALFDIAPQELMGSPTSGNGTSDSVILATLEGWLHNLKTDPRRNAR